MTILCVATASERADLVYQQLISYNKSFNNDVFHIIHVSTEFHAQLLSTEMLWLRKIESLGNVYLFNSVRTKHARIFHAFLQCVLKATILKIQYDYIYFHTSSDLLFRKDINAHIRNYDIGCADGLKISERDYWKDRILKNPNSSFLRNALNMSEVKKRRVEGAFFKKEIFFELIFPLMTTFGTQNLEMVADHPIEEVEFVWCVELFCSNNTVKRTTNTIAAIGDKNHTVTIHEIDTILDSDPNKFGAKRFSPDPSDSSRKHVFNLLDLTLEG